MSIATSTQVYEIYIRTTPEKLWQALIDPQLTTKYFFGTAVKTGAKAGDDITWTMPDGSVAVDGSVMVAEPPRKLVHTWVTRYDAEMAKETSTVTWTIEKLGDVCKLTAVHELATAPKTAPHVAGGWNIVLSGLKTLLETGKQLEIPSS